MNRNVKQTRLELNLLDYSYLRTKLAEFEGWTNCNIWHNAGLAGDPPERKHSDFYQNPIRLPNYTTDIRQVIRVLSKLSEKQRAEVCAQLVDNIKPFVSKGEMVFNVLRLDPAIICKEIVRILI